MMNLKATKKKAIILAIAGAFAATGIAAPLMQTVSASAKTEQAQAQQQVQPPKMTDEMAAQAAQKLGIDKQLLIDFQAKGNNIRDLHMAMVVADASQHSLTEVITAKISGSSWPELCKSYNLDETKLHQIEQDHMAKKLATEISLSEDTIKGLLGNGYQPQDIVMASILAKKADKDIQAVLDMKKINNHWQDVAKTLNVSDADIQAALQTMPHMMPGGPQQPGPGMPPPADAPAPPTDSAPAADTATIQ